MKSAKLKLLSLFLATLMAFSTMTVVPLSVFADDTPTALTLTPNYGKIENYGSPKQTLFILTMTSEKGDDDTKELYKKVKNWGASLKLTITDTSTNEVQVIDNYYVQYPALEIPTENNYTRLSVSRYGVKLNPAHAYTLTVDVYENGVKTYSGTSAKGAFKSTQEDFLQNGTLEQRSYKADTTSPLYGKGALFIGDSITEAICEVNIPTYAPTAGWPGRVSAMNGMHFVNAGVSGWTISTKKSCIADQLKNNLGRPIDYIFIGGGANDAWFEAPVGSCTAANVTDMSKFDRATYAGGLEYTFAYAKENFPNAKIGYIMNFKLLGRWYSGGTLGYLDDMGRLFTVAKQICEKWDVPYVDLYNNDVVSERMQYTTTYAMGDYVHPNDKGFDILAPYIDQFARAVAVGMTQEEINALPDPEYAGPALTVDEDDVDVAFGKAAYNNEGKTITKATDGNWQAAEIFGTRVADAPLSEQPYLEIDLGWSYKIHKMRVSNYGPCMNLLYQYVILASNDNMKPMNQWTVLGENKTNIASGEGLIYQFDEIDTRYIRIVPTGSWGESTFYISSVQAFGERNPVDPTTGKEPVKYTDITVKDVHDEGTDLLTDGDTSENVYTVPFDGVADPSQTVLNLGGVKTISKVTIHTSAESDSGYSVWGSTDRLNWVKLGQKMANEPIKIWSTPEGGNFRYIKVRGEEGRGQYGGPKDGYILINQIQIFDENEELIPVVDYEEQNLAIAGWGTKNALDGILTGYPYFALGGVKYKSACYLTLDLGSLQDLRTLTFFLQDPTVKFNVSVSENGLDYVGYGSVTGNETYDPAKGLSFYGITIARYIRVEAADLAQLDGGKSFGLYEVEVGVKLNNEKAPEDASAGKSFTDIHGDNTALLTDGDTSEKAYALPFDGMTKASQTILNLGSVQKIGSVTVSTYENDSGFSVWGSTDGEKWTLLGEKSASSRVSTYNAKGGEYQYIKVRGETARLGIGDGYIVITQITVKDSAGSALKIENYQEQNIAIGGWTTKNAIDGSANDGNYLALGASTWGSECKVTLNLGEIRDIRSILLYPVNTDVELTVSISTDGVNYAVYGKLNDKTPVDEKTGAYILKADAEARYVTLSISAADYSKIETTPYELYEIQVMAKPQEFLREDLDGNGELTIQDVTTLLNYLTDPENALAEGRTGDINGDGKVTIKDVSTLLKILAA